MQLKSGAFTNRLLWIPLVAIFCIAALVVSSHVNQQRPYRYYLKEKSRGELVAELEQELGRLVRLNSRDGTHTAWNDVERLMPHDRTQIVLGIQRYYQDKGVLPQSLIELVNAGYVDTKKLQYEYRIVTESGNWTLFGPPGIIATGE